MVSRVRANSRILCSRPPAEICAIAQPDVEQTHLIIKSLDAMEGRGTELARLPLDPHETGWSADLSVDGSRIAALKSPTSPISIVNIYDKTTTTIAVKNWSNLRSLRWAANGKGLFVGAGFSPGSLIISISPETRICSGLTRRLFVRLHPQTAAIWPLPTTRWTGICG